MPPIDIYINMQDERNSDYDWNATCIPMTSLDIQENGFRELGKMLFMWVYAGKQFESPASEKIIITLLVVATTFTRV